MAIDLSAIYQILADGPRQATDKLQRAVGNATREIFINKPQRQMAREEHKLNMERGVRELKLTDLEIKDKQRKDYLSEYRQDVEMSATDLERQQIQQDLSLLDDQYDAKRLSISAQRYGAEVSIQTAALENASREFMFVKDQETYSMAMARLSTDVKERLGLPAEYDPNIVGQVRMQGINSIEHERNVYLANLKSAAAAARGGDPLKSFRTSAVLKQHANQVALQEGRKPEFVLTPVERNIVRKETTGQATAMLLQTLSTVPEIREAMQSTGEERLGKLLRQADVVLSERDRIPFSQLPKIHQEQIREAQQEIDKIAAGAYGGDLAEQRQRIEEIVNYYGEWGLEFYFEVPDTLESSNGRVAY